jgi:hypothetical protein
VSDADRHRRAVERTLGWAQAAAAAGDLPDALAWLDMVRAMDGPLPGAWEERRRQWIGALDGTGGVPTL